MGVSSHWEIEKQEVRMRKKERVGRVLVGVDDGEWKEQGRGGRSKRSRVVKGRRSTHEFKALGEDVVGLKNGLEVSVRARSREGVVRDSMGAASAGNVDECVGSVVGGVVEEATTSPGGRMIGWDTRRVPNRYDYYLEGHRINRVSQQRAKSSLDGEGENRV